MYKTNNIYWPFLIVFDVIGYIFFFYKRFRKDPENIKNIAVIKLDHIGDMVLASSFFRNIKKDYPNAALTVICRSLTKPVAQCIPYIDNIIVLDVPWFSREKSTGWLSTLRFALSNFSKYDLSFELHTDPRNIFLASMIGRYSVSYGVRGGGFLLNKTTNWDNKEKHIVQRNLDILRGLGKKVDGGHLELKIDKKDIVSAKKKLKIQTIDENKIIILHPLSGRLEKNKPWSFWNDMIKKLSKEKLILIGGSKDEKDIINANIKKRPNVMNICGKLSLKEYLALLSIYSMAISPDTFVVHARNAFRKKIQVIGYPSYDKVQWGEYRAPRS